MQFKLLANKKPRWSASGRTTERTAQVTVIQLAPAGSAVADGEGPILFESLAIIEYLDETHPNPPLLPRDARGRARQWAFAIS